MSRASVRLGWRLGRFLALLAFAAALVGAGAYQVSARYELVRLGYRLDEERFEHRRQLEELKRRRLMLATWKDPLAVPAMARERLGMREAGQRDELFVPDEVQAPTEPVDVPDLLGPDGAGGSP